MIKLVISSEETGCRIDRILRKKLSLKKLSEIYALLRKGDVRVNEKRKKQDYRVQEGDELTIRLDPSELTASRSFEKSLEQIIHTDFFKRNFKILYEDSDFLACNKPAGLVVHPGTGHLHGDTLIELATGYLLNKGALRHGEEPALVHRLDRDTSGVILIAKSKRITRAIHEIFRSRDIVKQYISICHNRPPEFEGIIEVGMSRSHNFDSGTKMKVSKEGSITRSRYRILEYNNNLSKIEVDLETGKTHQIRVHLAHIGSPVVGDVRYGNKDLDRALLNKATSRLYLHAHKLSFNHPVTGKKIRINAAEPKEFNLVINNQVTRIKKQGSRIRG